MLPYLTLSLHHSESNWHVQDLSVADLPVLVLGDPVVACSEGIFSVVSPSAVCDTTTHVTATDRNLFLETKSKYKPDGGRTPVSAPSENG